MNMPIWYFIIFLLGLVIGSFLNVCIYRIPKEESVIKPFSHCTSCMTTLRALDLIPIFSYLFSRGRCRYCGAKFSGRYAVVELFTGILSVILFWKYGLTVEFFIMLYLVSVLVVVSFIDLEYQIIPNGLVIAGIIGGVAVGVYNIFVPVSVYHDKNLWTPLIGAFLGSGFLFIVSLIGMAAYKTDDVMGMGDVKIFFPIGLFLGWKLTVIVLFISIIVAGLSGIFLIVSKIKDRKSMVPFGPFISLGTFITVLYGWDILKWYIDGLL